MAKNAEFSFPGTMTLAGTVATDGLELEIAISAPPDGAGASRTSSLPPTLVPPPTLFRACWNQTSRGGWSVSSAVAVSPAMVAVMIATVTAEVTPVDIGKVAETLPAGTFTIAGTDASAFDELERLTAAPPAGAGEPKTTRFATVMEATPADTVLGARSTRRTPVDCACCSELFEM